jgi:predicted SprT family Zn-dependent metalloprotease
MNTRTENTRYLTRLAYELFQQHNLHGWSFDINTNKRRRGVCKYRPKRIELSYYALDDLKAAENTLRHEVAHAIVGPTVKSHGREWRHAALAIGCDGQRCGVSMMVEPKYVGVCPNGHTAMRHRRVKRNRIVACGQCCKLYAFGKFDPRFAFTWTAK